MLALRLQRIGRRNEAHFKIVVIEKTRGPKSQKYVDIVGSYNPKLGRVLIDEEKAKAWLEKGVKPSDTVYNMLVDKGIIKGKKKNVLPRKTPIVREGAEDSSGEAGSDAPAEGENASQEIGENAESTSEESGEGSAEEPKGEGEAE